MFEDFALPSVLWLPILCTAEQLAMEESRLCPCAQWDLLQKQQAPADIFNVKCEMLHYIKTQRSQNRKCITSENDRATATGNIVTCRKFREVWTRDFWERTNTQSHVTISSSHRANRSKPDKQTDTWSQYFASLSQREEIAVYGCNEPVCSHSPDALTVVLHHHHLDHKLVTWRHVMITCTKHQFTTSSLSPVASMDE